MIDEKDHLNINHREGPMSKINVLGIDLAKNIFQVHGNDEKGRCVLKKKLSRTKLKEFVCNLEPCLIGMEACGGAHDWARRFKKMGHEVKLISPQFVKPFVKTNKNDARDAEAIAEAVVRPNMRFVSVKEPLQQEMKSLHRVRERLIKNRTALSNQVRGLLQEFGLVMNTGLSRLNAELPGIIEDADNGLSPGMREILENLRQELKIVQEHIEFYEQRIKKISAASGLCQRLEEIEGVGVMTSTAVISTVADARVFKNGRQFSAYLGLVPKQHSSGGKNILLGISKRGDGYLRKLLIHGARAVVEHVDKKDNRIHSWVKAVEKRRGKNKAVVALANKNARVIWALMAHGDRFKERIIHVSSQKQTE